MNSYTSRVNTAHKGLFLILIDQSSSMSGKKALNAADAVNRVIYEIMIACQEGETIRDRCFVGVIGYGDKVTGIVGNQIPEIAKNPLRVDGVKPIWVEPVAQNGTPMAEAFAKAYELASSWSKDDMNKESFPPLVINITDGAPNDFNHSSGDAPETREAVRRLVQLATSDGNLLLFNIHISESAADLAQERVFPASVNDLPDAYARFLFNISSVLPATLLKMAEKSGLPSQSGSRGLAYNATAETLVKVVDFGSKVSDLVSLENGA